MTERSPTRAIVLTAASATTIRLLLAEHPALDERLHEELELGPTFHDMTDSDLGVLMQRLELEFYERGWRPQRAWRRATEQEE